MPHSSHAAHKAVSMTPAMVMLFAFCCGAIVANIYYAQPIIELIAPDIGLSSTAASLIVSLTQIGYALGLFFLVPLGDLLENRRLMLITTAVAVLSLLGAAFAEQPNLFLLVSLLVGFSSVSVQMLIPLAAHLAPEESRGRVVGGIMGGLLLGILLARPICQSGGRPFRLARSVRGSCRGDDRYQCGAGNHHAQTRSGSSCILRPVAVLALDAFAHPAGAAPAGFLSSMYVRNVQPVLDRRAPGAVTQSRAVADPDRDLCPDRRNRCHCGPHQRASGRRRLHPHRVFGRTSVRCTELSSGPYSSCLQRDRPCGNGRGAGFLRADQHGVGPANRLCTGCRQPQPAQRPVHDQHFHRRRDWLGGGQPVV